ncbi:uncharacterized protein LOC119591169 isoform X2 [Penaeus monodon]|uniref:uncharacterized protein LOC119591169 isoform X2 n=1 Tax=Penaeus monodon TaxID=6687 RepID=UPI0018A7CA40|nr:uncharacterized protein LOC119591169 isoform X2 [Penaeus monodon]
MAASRPVGRAAYGFSNILRNTGCNFGASYTFRAKPVWFGCPREPLSPPAVLMVQHLQRRHLHGSAAACSTCAQQIAQASSSQHVCSPAHELAPALSNGNGSGMGGGNGRRLNRRTELDFEELMALQMAGDIALIDVRNPKELEKHDAIPGAVNIPLCHLKLALQLSDEEWAREFQVEKPAKCDRNLVFYARGPNASSAAVEIAHRLGFKMSRHYIGGWEEYSKKTGQPLTKSQDPSPFSNYYQNQFDQYFL